MARDVLAARASRLAFGVRHEKTSYNLIIEKLDVSTKCVNFMASKSAYRAFRAVIRNKIALWWATDRCGFTLALCAMTRSQYICFPLALLACACATLTKSLMHAMAGSRMALLCTAEQGSGRKDEQDGDCSDAAITATDAHVEEKKTYRTVGKKNLSGSVHAMLPYPGLTTRRHANTHIEKGKRVKQERTHKRKHNHTCKETHNSARHEKNDAAKQTATLTVSVTSSKAHFYALFRARTGARGPSGGQGRAAASHTGAEALRAGGGRRRRTEVERVILAVLFLILLARGLSVVQLLVRGLEVRVPVAGTVHHSTCRGRQHRGRGGHGGRSRCRGGRVAVARGARR